MNIELFEIMQYTNGLLIIESSASDNELTYLPTTTEVKIEVLIIGVQVSHGTVSIVRVKCEFVYLLRTMIDIEC